MKMYELQRLIQELPKTSPIVEIPIKKEFDISESCNTLNMIPSENNQLSKPTIQIKWWNVLPVSGFVIGLAYLGYKSPKNESYQSLSRRRRIKAQENN